MKVKVFGPNLSAAAQKLGQFHVHAADCGDCKHYGYRRKFGGDDEAHVFDTESKVRVVRFIYADIIAEDEGSDPLDYLDEFHFAPCCDFLPDVLDVAAAKAHAKLMQESAAAFDAEFIKPAGGDEFTAALVAATVAAIRAATDDGEAVQIAFPQARVLARALNVVVAGGALDKAQAVVRALRG